MQNRQIQIRGHIAGDILEPIHGRAQQETNFFPELSFRVF